MLETLEDRLWFVVWVLIAALGVAVFAGIRESAENQKLRAELRDRDVKSVVVTAPSVTIAEPVPSLQELVRQLRQLPPDTLQVVGYVGKDGNWHMLTEADLACQQPVHDLNYIVPRP